MTFSDALKMGPIILDGLALIKKIADKADSLATVRAAITALLDGANGKATPQEMLTRIEALHADLETNDSAADKALREKFDRG